MVFTGGACPASFSPLQGGWGGLVFSGECRTRPHNVAQRCISALLRSPASNLITNTGTIEPSLRLGYPLRYPLPLFQRSATTVPADTDKLAKLKQQQEKLKARIQKEQARISAKDRKADTRRKILDGALIQNHAKDNPDIAALLDRLRSASLTKPRDRALFGLDPLPESKDA